MKDIVCASTKRGHLALMKGLILYRIEWYPRNRMYTISMRPQHIERFWRLEKALERYNKLLLAIRDE